MNFTRTSFSIPEHMLKVAKRNAQRSAKNFSAYVVDLLTRDNEAISERRKSRSKSR